MIELARLDKKAALTPKPMAVTDLYSEAEGYHFPGFQWGGDFTAFQKATDYSVTDMEGYTEEETVYTAGGLKRSFFDVANDTASIGCRGKDEVAFVSLNFSKGVDADAFASFAEQLKAAAREAFGAPDEVISHNEEVDGKLYNYETSFWRKTVDGKITELQLGTATLPGSSSPNYLSLGVDYRWAEGVPE